MLRAGGQLVISTPVLETYTALTPNNPFHCSEMSIDEFRGVLEAHFDHPLLYGQCPPVQWYESWRGFGRATKLLKKLFKADQPVELDQDTRNRVVDLCSDWRSRAPKYLVNTAVRRMGPTQLQTCVYVVAVAKLKRAGREDAS